MQRPYIMASGRTYTLIIYLKCDIIISDNLILFDLIKRILITSLMFELLLTHLHNHSIPL